MPISLGSSAITQDSRHTFLMIVFVQSFYFLSLGLCLVMYDQQLSQQQQSRGLLASVSTSVSSLGDADKSSDSNPVAVSPATPAPKPGEVLSLDFLFAAGSFSHHPHHAVLLVYLLHGILLGGCVGLLVERRTWCLDMVLTVEGIFLVATLCVAGFVGVAWRVVCLAIDTVCALCVSLYVAGRREQQEVSFAPPATSAV